MFRLFRQLIFVLPLTVLIACESPTSSNAPTLLKTRFLAFGDSITFGRCGPVTVNGSVVCPSYMVRLEELLSARYTSQTFTMTVSAVGGERTAQGEARLRAVLDANQPEVLLLMEGTNDVVANPLDINGAVDSLEGMINIARGRGIVVFLATIPPIGPGGQFNYAVGRVPEMNNAIRSAAARRGAILVDVFSALNTDVARYYPIEDLHPTGDGMRVIGDTFYASVRHALESKAPAVSSGLMLAAR